MKSKFGVFFMLLGAVLVAAALALCAYNMRQQTQAADSAEAVMPQLVGSIQTRQEQQETESGEADASRKDHPDLLFDQRNKEMAVVEIDGYGYIGFVSVPSLNLELPVMADWSYSQLQIAPCRYFGSIFTDDLVVMAHNYYSHFGRLKDLHLGDQVIFTDMDGKQIYYEVMALDVLDPTAVEDMTAGIYDFTLFTCTYGGQSRVTVFCERIEE